MFSPTLKIVCASSQGISRTVSFSWKACQYACSWRKGVEDQQLSMRYLQVFGGYKSCAVAKCFRRDSIDLYAHLLCPGDQLFKRVYLGAMGVVFTWRNRKHDR